MRHMALLNRQHRVLLIASLISSCVLAACASPFERFYKPAATNYGTPVSRPATPLYAWSPDPERDGKKLEQEGYVLIGTSSFEAALRPFVPSCSYYLPDSSLDSASIYQPGSEQYRIWASQVQGWPECGALEAEQAVSQGKRVGAAVVLLNVHVNRWGFGRHFASYWAKADHAG